MKKTVLTVLTIAAGVSFTVAQKYDGAKNLLMLQQYVKAKEDLDKNWSNPKYTSKPEAFILKSAIYGALGNDPTKKEQSEPLINSADSNYQHYLSIDPAKSLIKDQAYISAPINIYSSLFNRGVSQYSKKEYEAGLASFKKVLMYSDFMAANEIAKIVLDTNALLLAGACAQSASKDDDAVIFFSKLANAKVGGSENEFVHQFMMQYYFKKEDIANFEKYKAIGQELYPTKEFYKYTEEDFVMSIPEEKERMRRTEGLMAKDPNNFKLLSIYGETLFEKLNPKENETPLPDNAAELEAKMVAVFNKAASLDTKNAASFMNLANHFLNKSVRTGNSLREHQKMMRDKQKANTPEPVKGKPAPKAPAPDPADVEKRKALQAEYEVHLEDAKTYYEKSVDVYKTVENLAGVEKQNYRNAVSYLIDIYKEKKDFAIRDKKPADEVKFAALEKKYSDLYSTLH